MKIFLFLATLIISTTSVLGNNMLLKFDDVQFFKCKETRSETTIFLEISGLAFHSSLAVKGIDSKLENDTMIILVHLTPARNGLSGNFSYHIEIPEKINSIFFGPSKKLLWSRKGGGAGRCLNVEFG